MADQAQPKVPLWSRKPILRSESFQKHIAARHPEILYHYTNQIGLIGIMTANELWATKVQYMNDSTEFGTSLDLVDSYVGLALPGMPDGPEKKKRETLLHLSKGISNINLFAACFCEDGDLLSQWRGYAGSDSGYAIGFNSATLSANSTHEKWQLAKCIYSRTMQKTIIQELVDDCLSNPSATASDLEASLAQVGAFFKSDSFSEEKEWRIVSGVRLATEVGAGFRPGRSMVTPFFKFPLWLRTPNALLKVLVGPCPHPELSMRAVRMLGWKAELMGARQLPVEQSAIPYRNW